MTVTLINRSIRAPRSLQWWEWGKIHGAINLIALFLLLALGVPVPPFVVAAMLHFAVDYTFQSAETAARKGDPGRHLLVHAIVAGGIPTLIAGLLTGNAGLALTATIASILSHYGIDWTRKFGIQSVIIGAVTDQVCHILTYAVLFL